MKVPKHDFELLTLISTCKLLSIFDGYMEAGNSFQNMEEEAKKLREKAREGQSSSFQSAILD